jgi:DNA-binding NarL/FixJ family response regulator
MRLRRSSETVWVRGVDDPDGSARAMSTKTTSTPTPVKRRVLIVDHHPLVRRGLTALIDNEPDLSVCAAVATPQEGLAAIGSSRPDLVIADPMLGEGDGLALLEDIRSAHAALPVLVLSLHDAPLVARRALRAGASGYVTKGEMGETLLIAIRCLLAGQSYLSPKIREGLDRG